MIYILNILISLMIGYFFHVTIHKIPFLKKKHFDGHHDVYENKVKTKEYISNGKNCFKVFNLHIDVEYFVIFPFVVYCYVLSFFDVNFFIIIPTIVFLLFCINYFHKAFHTAGHPLNRYKIFRDASHRHVLHHVHETIWYGVGLGDWVDVVFRTNKKNKKEKLNEQ